MGNKKLGKHTLIIDGNYFIHSRLFVLPRKKGVQLLGDDEGKSQFMRKLCIDFASETRKMSPFVDQIVLAIDSKSWRKDLFPEAQYKGTRTQKSDVNWDSVFYVYKEFQDVLAKQGVIINRVNGAEADDILFGWSTQLNTTGKNTIVWTGDRDLIQLVDYNNANESYSLWYYNTKRKLIAFEGFEEVLNKRKTDNMSNDDLLFNMGGSDAMHDDAKEKLQAWIKSNGVDIEEVNCDDFIFLKILQGDKSDNIKSVVTWEKESSTGKIRTFSITEKVAIKVLERYKEIEGNFNIDHFFNKDRVDIIVDLIHEIVGKLEKEEIKVRFNQNLDLMLLHFNTIPDPIQKGIYEAIERDLNIEPTISNLSRMETILEGTEWENAVKKNTVPKQFDPFAGLDTKGNNDRPATKDLNSLF
jgi:5'-3' exonuclease